MDNVVKELNLTVSSITKKTINDLVAKKSALAKDLNGLKKTRDSDLKIKLKGAQSELSTQLSSLNTGANRLTDAKDNSIALNNKNYNTAVKTAQTNKENAMKGYKLTFSSELDGVAYYKAYVGGMFGKKSQHENCKVLGVESDSSKTGEKLVVRYQRGNQKEQTTAITNVCVLKQ